MEDISLENLDVTITGNRYTLNSELLFLLKLLIWLLNISLLETKLIFLSDNSGIIPCNAFTNKVLAVW